MWLCYIKLIVNKYTVCGYAIHFMLFFKYKYSKYREGSRGMLENIQRGS